MLTECDVKNGLVRANDRIQRLFGRNYGAVTKQFVEAGFANQCAWLRSFDIAFKARYYDGMDSRRRSLLYAMVRHRALATGIATKIGNRIFFHNRHHCIPDKMTARSRTPQCGRASSARRHRRASQFLKIHDAPR
jgi:hypothetical protein